jgi:starch synthase
VIETCLVLGWYPDIIHCNDWQTALVPAFAKVLFPKEFRKTKIVFTIHNFNQQGVFPGMDYKITGLPVSIKAKFRHKNRFNFIKGALLYSDFVTTVSPSYAQELLNDKENTDGLNSFLKDNKKKFKGIINGIDPYTWNPKKDNEIEMKFDGNFEEYKYTNKVALLNKMGLEYNPKTAVIGMITRLDQQKGVDLLIEAADKILKEDVQIIILGKGDADIRKKLTRIAKKYPDKFKVKFGMDEPRAHLIEAGSDMFLLPSLLEPCGLNLMYSLIYGSIPIVRRTGGMKDVAEGFNPNTKKGNSFVFDDYKASELVKTIQNALIIFKDQELWETLAKNGMEGDYTWKKSAKEYDEIYRMLMRE